MPSLRSFGRVLVLILVAAASPAAADTIRYSITMSGAQVVPGPGDPDGTAIGTLWITENIGPNVSLIFWDFTYANIGAPTSMHIHFDGPGDAGAGLTTVTTGGPGTLINSITTTWDRALPITASPTDYFVDIHTAAFPFGAIRGQLDAGVVVPEPSLSLLLGVAALAAARFAPRDSAPRA